jgi:solute carrier family 25 uncoupling protein 27
MELSKAHSYFFEGTPADVIKTRVMNQPTDDVGRGLIYKGSVDCFQQTVKKEGFFAL